MWSLAALFFVLHADSATEWYQHRTGCTLNHRCTAGEEMFAENSEILFSPQPSQSRSTAGRLVELYDSVEPVLQMIMRLWAACGSDGVLYWSAVTKGTIVHLEFSGFFWVYQLRKSTHRKGVRSRAAMCLRLKSCRLSQAVWAELTVRRQMLSTVVLFGPQAPRSHASSTATRPVCLSACLPVCVSVCLHTRAQISNNNVALAS